MCLRGSSGARGVIRCGPPSPTTTTLSPFYGMAPAIVSGYKTCLRAAPYRSTELYPRRGFERAPGPPRGAFRPPSCLAPLAPRGQPGLIRTARGSFIGSGSPWEEKPAGSSLTTLALQHVARAKAQKKHSQTLNIDLSFSDRARSLLAVFIPWAAGTVQARASIDDALPSSLKAAASAMRKR